MYAQFQTKEHDPEEALDMDTWPQLSVKEFLDYKEEQSIALRKARDEEDRKQQAAKEAAEAMSLRAKEAAEALSLRYPAMHHPLSALLELHREMQGSEKMKEEGPQTAETQVMESEPENMPEDSSSEYEADPAFDAAKPEHKELTERHWMLAEDEDVN